MKKQLFIALALILTFGFTSCKKETTANKPLREKVLGRWELVKTETTVAGALPIVTNYTSSDYYEFKSGDDDVLERKQGSNTQYGNYVFLSSNDFNLSIEGKTYACMPTVVEESKFEFTAKEGSLSMKVYLKR